MLPKWSLADIQARMFNRPLLVTRDRAEIALGVMGPKLDIGTLVVQADGQRLSASELKAKAVAAKAEVDSLPGDDGLKKYGYDFATDTFAERDPYEIWNGAAIFTVRGTLMAENGIDPYSGATGYDGLSFKARHAEANAAVKGGILDIDSGGGEVVDLLELCSQLRAFAEKKPLRAIIRGTGCSAAYALAACAGPGNITAAPYSVVGSIGAIMMHADFSRQLEAEGIDVTMITSAPHKADAAWTKPLEPDVQERLQAMVDECAASFIGHVVDARSADRAGIEAQEARFYSGQDVLDLGLVDKFMPWADSMKEFAEGLSRRSQTTGSIAPSGASSSAKKGTAMSTEANAPAASDQPVYTQAQQDAAVASAQQSATTAAAAAERERVTQLAEIDGGSSLSAELSEAISAGTSVADFALAQSRAAKAKRDGALAAAKNEAVQANQMPEGGASATRTTGAAAVNRGKAYADRKKAGAAA